MPNLQKSKFNFFYKQIHPPITIKKRSFARDPDFGEDSSSFLEKIYNNFNLLGKSAFAIILAPTIVVGSLYSNAAFLMIANILLAVAYLAKFIDRIVRKKVSIFEFVLSLIFMALLFLLAFYFLPSMPGWCAISILCFANLFATSINAFFLIKDLILPPIQSIFNENSFIVDKLDLINNPKHIYIVNNIKARNDQENMDDEEIVLYTNQLLGILELYVNKYQNKLFGYINQHNKIEKINKEISNIQSKGDLTVSIAFIADKIGRKCTKIELMKSVKNELHSSDIKYLGKFFKSIHNTSPETISECNLLLDKEIARQKDKIDKLALGLLIKKPGYIVEKMQKLEINSVSLST